MPTIVFVSRAWSPYPDAKLYVMNLIHFTSHRLSTFAVALASLLAVTLPAAADVITLKDGTSVEGVITVEGSDMVRIEVQVSGSIKETKTFAMTEVAKIDKTAADKLAFAAIKESVPAPDLMSSSSYDEMMRNGPKRFLNTYPDSEHRAEVEAIIKQLEEEKAKVQLGAIKLNGEWISREERTNRAFAIEAAIRELRMRQKSGAGDLLGAMREFEGIEENYKETPAHAAALKNALAIVPAWGNNLKRQLTNVEFLNQRDAEALKLAKEDEVRQVEQAKAAEKARYEAAIKAEKDQGILWNSVNFRDAESLKNGVALAQTELARLGGIDLAALTKTSELLAEANVLIGEGNVGGARAKLSDAIAASGSSSKKSSSKSKKSDSSTTFYSRWLADRIDEVEKELAAVAAAKAAAEARAKATGTATLAAADGDAPKDPADPDATSETVPDAADKPMSRQEIMAAERARAEAKMAADEKNKPEPKTSKKPGSKKAPLTDEEEEEAEKKKKERAAAAASSGGGFSFQKIIPIIAVLLIITVIVLKKLGIGGAKPDAE